MAEPVAATSFLTASSLVTGLVVALLYLTSCCVSWPLITVGVLVVCVSACLPHLRRRDGLTDRRVCVLVLGDIGRSPRMQYHALSFSKHGYTVNLVGFLGTKPHKEIVENDNIKITPIAEVKGIQSGPRMLTYVTKVSLQSLQLLRVLLTTQLPAYVLLQNPPGLPSMALSFMVCTLRGSTLLIDWHNYGFTIMALSLGARHPVVRLAKWYEHFFGALASHHLCVTQAMREDLQQNWAIRATTLYDKPPAIFRETPLSVQHELFVRLARSIPQFQPGGGEDSCGPVERTVFTCRDLADDSVTLSPDRPALLLSSTSWTEDEDFSLLLNALEEYEGCVREGRSLPVREGRSLPALVCVITGKGPQKEHYMRLIDQLQLEHVKICTPWLEAEDYPLLLGSADLGVCLHKSSSGLDLPMKVVDMFGCCLPVCAIDFNCLSELVKHEENGLIFKDAQQLAQQLMSLLKEFRSSEGRLATFRRNLQTSGGQRWDDNWDQTVLPLIAGHR